MELFSIRIRRTFQLVSTVSTWTEDGKYLKAFEKIGGVRKFHVYNESDDNATGYIRCVKDKE